MAELWDGYYADGTLSGDTFERGKNDIPKGQYHLVCDVLVRHEDGDYLLMKRSYEKEKYGGFYEASAGGSAIKGEDKYACAYRELFEETGVKGDNLRELSRFVFDEKQCIFFSFLCITNCDKSSITLQEGETIGYKWVSEEEFIEFINSENIIPGQKKRYMSYFDKMGYIRQE